MSKKTLFISCLPVFIFMSGCIPKERYTRQVNLAIPVDQAESFTAKTHNGNITINGSQTTDCSLTAKITGAADTEENAKKVAEAVNINLVPDANGIKVNIEKPEPLEWSYVIVDMDVNLPAGMNLALESHNGTVRSNGVTGIIKARTHNGKVKVTGATGPADLSTHNGQINYTGVLANLSFETHNGNIEIQCAGLSESPCQIIARTHNGNIEFIAPENFSAAIMISTHHGLVHSDLPITVTEKTKERLEGTIGDGRDKLILKTHNGLITIK